MAKEEPIVQHIAKTDHWTYCGVSRKALPKELVSKSLAVRNALKDRQRDESFKACVGRHKFCMPCYEAWRGSTYRSL